MAKTSSPRRARTNSSPSIMPDIMLPSPRSRIGNPFLKSGLFVSGVSAMIGFPPASFSSKQIRITIQSRSCGSGERCTIISGELFNALACKLVAYIKRFPRSFQVKLFVRDRFTGSLVLKLPVGHREIAVRPQFQNFRRYSYKLRFEHKTVKQVFQTADACC